MILHEQHGGDDDVARGDIVAAALQCVRIVRPLGRGVQRQGEAWNCTLQLRPRGLGGPGKVAVERYDDHPDGRSLSG
jgi:hypothetical protein